MSASFRLKDLALWRDTVEALRTREGSIAESTASRDVSRDRAGAMLPDFWS